MKSELIQHQACVHGENGKNQPEQQQSSFSDIKNATQWFSFYCVEWEILFGFALVPFHFRSVVVGQLFLQHI